jgi:3-oxoacyl-(acyl-carrier-protein) synthase
MLTPVYIAGTGAISAIGFNVAENLSALKSGEAGIGPIQYLSTIHKETFPSGEVKAANAELAERCGWIKPDSRTAMLGFLAAREALRDAGLSGKNPFRTGLISASSVGGMDLTENFFPEFMQDHQAGRLRNVVRHECGAVTEKMATELKISEFVSTISTACSSSANAIMLGARMIRNGLLDVAVAGGTDALSKFTLNGFNTLMILDHALCQPFDKNRRGLNLGEGAGFLVLVSERVAGELGKKMVAKLTGYSNANDAHHQTASSPDGTGSFLAMNGALKMASLSPGDIDYINLHGTGTQNNDASESTAIRRIFGSSLPGMSSTKSFTGHTLAACGGLEAVYAVHSIREQCLFPGLRIDTPIIEEAGVMVNSFTPGVELKHILSNSFGFGGNCSSLIFSAT